jgi:hypothetical protein
MESNISATISICPIIHIADATSEATRVGLEWAWQDAPDLYLSADTNDRAHYSIFMESRSLHFAPLGMTTKVVAIFADHEDHPWFNERLPG